MDQKRFFIREYESDQFKVTELAERFGISRKTAHKCIKRYLEGGLDGLNERSSRPLNSPTKTPANIEKQILELRKQKPRYGARKLIKILSRDNPDTIYPPVSTVNSILKRNGLTKTIRRRRRIKAVNIFSVATHPNDIWTTDYKGEFTMKNGKRCYPLTLCDMYSRYIVSIKGLYSTDLIDAKAFYKQAFKDYGLPHNMLCDNGTPFAAAQSLARLTRLSVWWIKLGITPVFIDPGCPAQNGKHERMHRELKAETAKPPAYDMRAQQRKFNRFKNEYNQYRPHEALNDDTPSQHYQISPREFPNRIKPYEYPLEFNVRRVSRNGAIRWPGDRWLCISTSLIQENIGLEEINDGFWCVWFCNIRLGYFDEKKLRIEDDLGRYKRNLINN